MPKVSVVMSVYNDERFVGEAIESILAQTLKEFEFIIVNDGSTDNTKGILSSFEDKRIVVIDQENCGIAKAKNRAIALASGRYIAIMDSDDVSMPERLERQADFLDRNNEAGLVGTSGHVMDEKGDILYTLFMAEDNETIQRKLPDVNCFIHSSVMFRREAIEKMGGYRDEFKNAEDYDLFLRISEHYKLYNLKDILCKYRMNRSGITLGKMRQQKRWAKLASYLAEERRAGRSEELESNKARIIGRLDKGKTPGLSDLWYKYCLLSGRYYGIGCMFLYKGNMGRAKELFLRSLRYNFFNIKAQLGLFLSFLPFSLVRRLKFLFKTTAQYYRDLKV